MKKIVSLILAATMLLSLSACNAKTGNTNVTQAPSNQQTNADGTLTNASESKAIDGTAAINSAMIPGSIYYLYVEDGKEPVIKGVTLSGNRAGSTEFNSKKPATERSS